MKISSFNPIIITKNPEAVISVFESLGFEKKHSPNGISGAGLEYTDVRMTSPNGFYVDVATTTDSLPRDITAIRMNVDDFDEAFKFLTEKGFTTARPVTETQHSTGILMFSPSGFSIVLVQHIK